MQKVRSASPEETTHTPRRQSERAPWPTVIGAGAQPDGEPGVVCGPGRGQAGSTAGDFSRVPALSYDRTNLCGEAPLSERRRQRNTHRVELAIGRVDDPLEVEADRLADLRATPAGPVRSEAVRQLQVGRRSTDGQDGDAARNMPAGVASGGTSKVLEPVHDVIGSPGKSLDLESLTFFESRFKRDFSHVRIHTDQRAAESARAIDALAYSAGHHIAFAEGAYRPTTSEGRRLLAHELAHVVQQAYVPTNNAVPTLVRRKELPEDTALGAQDWTTADRVGNKQRWQDACKANLNAVDSSQYARVEERRDFYKWFYEYTSSLGYTTRWALAAHIVATGAEQIADMDVEHAVANKRLDLANVELQGAMREGNQVIFDNVLPKLKRLLDGGRLTGRAALQWDMQVLAEEQALVQAMYSRLSKETKDELDYIARKKRFAGFGAWWSDEDKVKEGNYNSGGRVPGFDQPDLQAVGDRWKYGMSLGNQFSKGGSGYDPETDAMPPVSAGYQSGSELAKVDTRANLHELDAWLNPNRLTRTGGGSDIQAIISKLSAFEKQQVLLDRSPDGWAYSAQMARFGAVTEVMVRQALPSDPSLQAAVEAFVGRYNAARTR